MSQDERRKFHRISFDAPVAIEQKGLKTVTEVIDISLKGILLKNPSLPLNGNQDCTLNIALSDEAHIILTGRIVYQNPKGLGFEYEHIDLESMSHLRRILELNSTSEDLLDREFEALIP
jgi:hypothetical protein